MTLECNTILKCGTLLMSLESQYDYLPSQYNTLLYQPFESNLHFGNYTIRACWNRRKKGTFHCWHSCPRSPLERGACHVSGKVLYSRSFESRSWSSSTWEVKWYHTIENRYHMASGEPNAIHWLKCHVVVDSRSHGINKWRVLSSYHLQRYALGFVQFLALSWLNTGSFST